MKPRYKAKYIKSVIFALFFFLQTAEAMMHFMPTEQLVATSEYIVVAKVENACDTGKKVQYAEISAKIIQNTLQVIESIKGSLSKEKLFVIHTLKFDGWMEDNVELPPEGSTVLLFLKKSAEGGLKPVNGIQGVWYMDDNGKFTRIGHGSTLKQIREMVQNQQSVCTGQVFVLLIETAAIQIQAGLYKEALENFRKAYGICPMRDLEEVMAWLMGEVESEK